MSDSLLDPTSLEPSATPPDGAADRRRTVADRRSAGFDFPQRLEDEWARQQQAANDPVALPFAVESASASVRGPAQDASLPASYLDALYAWGVHCYSRQRWSDAFIVMRHLASVAPHDVRFQRAWGSVLLATERHAQAAAAFESAQRLAPHDAENLFHWAQALHLMGLTSSAVPRWQQARELARMHPARWPQLEAWCDDWLAMTTGL